MVAAEKKKQNEEIYEKHNVAPDDVRFLIKTIKKL